jgi:methylthioribose-1-phosphate isomerase
MDHPDVLAWRDGHIEALDQTALPHQVRTLRIGTVDELVRAITSLAIRGAPVLGAAGALGVALAVRQGSGEGWDDTRLAAEIARIAAARPTAVNLSREVAAVAARIGDGSAAVEGAALAVLESTAATSLRISARGAEYLLQACGAGPLRVHTHCNTGALACLGWGTALGVIRALHVAGALSHVIVDETRPLLQGARLTCWELGQLGIEHQLACDGAAPFLISQGRADAVVVGADRIAANGDVANKIGTYSLALAARQAGIPFVVAAQVVEVNAAILGDGQKGDFVAILFETLTSVEHGFVLDHLRDDVVALLAVHFRGALDRQIVRLGGAAGEDDFLRRRVDQPGDLGARVLHRFLGRPAERVVAAGSVAELIVKVRQHCLDHARVHRCGGVVIHVDRQFYGHACFPPSLYI